MKQIDTGTYRTDSDSDDCCAPRIGDRDHVGREHTGGERAGDLEPGGTAVRQAATGGEGAEHVAIIGSGSAAFACAIEAADRGSHVTMIERSPIVGGCCVNVGCIPSKRLIRAGQVAAAQRAHSIEGIGAGEPAIDAALLTRRRRELVEELRDHKYENILRDNPDISLVHGDARFLGHGVESGSAGAAANGSGGHPVGVGGFDGLPLLDVLGADGSRDAVAADRVLIATGSRPAFPPIDGIEQVPYWTSTEALFAEEVPEHLIIIGSSAVAVEIAQAWRRLGASVTILARRTLLTREDELLGAGLTAAFEREGIRVITDTQATSVRHDGTTFTLETNAGRLSGDRLMVATGRRANTEALNLDAVGVTVDEHGAIEVDERMRTSAANIYAAGDCSTMPQFVYVAATAGKRAAANMHGEAKTLDLSTMPAVIFTDPQVATVGMTETQAARAGLEAESRVLSLDQVPRALVNGQIEGFVKLVAGKATGRLLGAQILAPEAGEMIQSVALAMRGRMTVDDLRDGLFPYLTMSEAIKLAAQSFTADVRRLSCCAG